MSGGDDSAAGRLWYGGDFDRLSLAESRNNNKALAMAGLFTVIGVLFYIGLIIHMVDRGECNSETLNKAKL